MANMGLDWLAGGGLDAELDGSGRRRRGRRGGARRVVAAQPVYVQYLAEQEAEEIAAPLALVPGLDEETEDYIEIAGSQGVEGVDFYIDGAGKKKKKKKKKAKRATGYAGATAPAMIPGLDPYAEALAAAPAQPAPAQPVYQGPEGPSGPSFARSVDSGEPFPRRERSGSSESDFEAIGGAFQRDVEEEGGAFVDVADFDQLDAAPARETRAREVVETDSDDEMVFDVPEGSGGLNLVPGLSGSGCCNSCEKYRRYPGNYGLPRNP